LLPLCSWCRLRPERRSAWFSPRCSEARGEARARAPVRRFRTSRRPTAKIKSPSSTGTSPTRTPSHTETPARTCTASNTFPPLNSTRSTRSSGPIRRPTNRISRRGSPLPRRSRSSPRGSSARPAAG
jgi:hypothetical protein